MTPYWDILLVEFFFLFFSSFSLFCFLNYAKMVEDILLGFLAFILGPKAARRRFVKCGFTNVVLYTKALTQRVSKVFPLFY